MITQVDTNLWRGPRLENMDEIKALGIQQIINLEVGWFELFHCLEGKEKIEASVSGITYEHEPISDWMFPTKKEFDNILRTLIWNAGMGLKTYVHCLHGCDRTGLVCAAYRVKKMGWGIDQAIAEMYSMGFHIYPYDIPLGWIKSLKEYLK